MHKRVMVTEVKQTVENTFFKVSLKEDFMEVKIEGEQKLKITQRNIEDLNRIKEEKEQIQRAMDEIFDFAFEFGHTWDLTDSMQKLLLLKKMLY